MTNEIEEFKSVMNDTLGIIAEQLSTEVTARKILQSQVSVAVTSLDVLQETVNLMQKEHWRTCPTFADSDAPCLVCELVDEIRTIRKELQVDVIGEQ